MRSAVASPAACAVLLLGVAAGCAPATEAEPTGSVGAVVTVRQSASATVPAAKAVWIRLYGPAARGGTLDLWAEAKPTSSGFQLAIAKVPAGSYQVHGVAFVAAPHDPRTTVPDYATVTDPIVQITSKSTQFVALVLQQNAAKWPPGTFADRAPVVESIRASAFDVDSGDPSVPLVLAAVATDADGAADLASMAWSATYAPPLPQGVAPGVFGAPAAAATTWTPPLDYEGLVTFTFAATDRKGATASLSVALAVSPRNGRGTLVVIVSLNNAPDVTRVTAAPSQLAPGATTTLTVTATDPDGDPLAYTWSDGGCGGAFGDATDNAIAYTAPPSPSACAITVVVRDLDAGVSPPAPRGGRSAGELTINVRVPIVAYAPEFTWAFQAPADPVAPGARVVFRVEVAEPLAGGGSRPVAALAWSDGFGGAFAPLGPGLPMDVEWTAPACAGLAPPYGVDVSATATGWPPDGGPALASTFTFPVAVACP